MLKDYNKLLKRFNRLKYEDGSSVDVKLFKDKVTVCGKDITTQEVKGFKFYLTDVGLKFEKKIDRICKDCGFSDWYPSGEDSLSFF